MPLDAFSQNIKKTFQPNRRSLQNHEVPEWYNDAKLGIFIHWGLYSVPAWAPLSGELGTIETEEWFKNNAYAEWYLNTLRIPDSPTQKHHENEYGKGFDYYKFAETFNKEILNWNPEEWANLFKNTHARYVVLTTKHHDGFLLWPSGILNPYLTKYPSHADRDVIKELTEQVRLKGMKMGLYYSGGIDWSFNPVVIKDSKTFDLSAPPRSEQYVNYANNQYRELIDHYKPDILWNDITYPKKGNEFELFAYYYNEVPEGVINDRWYEDIHDFTTPEYTSYDEITPKKWEATRGLDFSFGYNKNSSDKETLSADQLIRSFIDIVSKNGNLLINVGPKPDGTIPERQKKRLEALGKWLDTNGDAIFGSRPWLIAESETKDGLPLRFTFKKDLLFMFLLDTPKNTEVLIPDLIVDDETKITMLGITKELQWKNDSKGLRISLPSDINSKKESAYTIMFDRQPILKMKK